MSPTFTLRLTVVSVTSFNRTTTVPRWVLESDDPAWTRLHSGEGNVNSATHLDWAQRWATEKVAEHSPYVVVRWIEDDEHHDGPAWIAELKRIRHDFRIAWANGETETLRAKNAADAEEIRDTIRHGLGFIELVNANDDADFVNLAHVFGITYQPTEVDL